MTVLTSITAGDVIAAFRKWGVPYATPYPDWATHNRNHKGDWGGIQGIFVHNFASNIADTSSEAYLYRGDTSRGMPGPLSQFSLRDDGTVGIIGWGRANHGGKGDPRTRDAARSNAMPLDGELRPSGSGTVDMNTNFIGIEMLYGGNKATDAQRSGIVLMCAALLDMLGGNSAGYGAGSVVAHRESTNQRSDPEGFSMATLRTQIAARLAAGPTGKPNTVPGNGNTSSPPNITPKPEDNMPFTPNQLSQYAGLGVHNQTLGRSGVTIGVTLERQSRTQAQVTELVGLVTELTAKVDALTALVAPVVPVQKP